MEANLGRSDAAQKDASASSNLPRDMISAFRTGTTKVKTGCIVCKIRRIKCDETKPHCKRCTSTGRKCEGYGEAPKRNGSKSPSKSPPRSPRREVLLPRTSSPNIYRPSVDVQGTSEERRSFHYFRSRKMSDMPGNFEPYFWDHVVLQLSHIYPTILQSLTALSALYEQHEKPGGGDGYALQQYNTAVNALLEYLASNQQDPRVALTSCLIFVWIEFLQNNLHSGFQHLSSGLKVLRDIRLSFPLGAQNQDTEDILGSLDRSFTRLRIQAAIHGSQGSDFTTSTTRELEILEPVPVSFLNVFEARKFLDRELNAIFGYIRTLQEKNYYSSIDIQAFTTIQTAHVDRLSQWQNATKYLILELETKQDRSQVSAILYLQLYYAVVSIIWKTMFAGTEMVFDAYTSEFETILTICSSLLDETSSTTPPVLSFDMGIIPPLFFLCLKCRIPPLRQRAITLLKRAPEREGLWHRDSIIQYCEWKISMEESWRGDEPQDEPLPVFARMYAEHLNERGDGGGGGSGKGGGRLMMRFKRGPAGLDIEDTIEIPGGGEMMRLMGNMV